MSTPGLPAEADRAPAALDVRGLQLSLGGAAVLRGVDLMLARGSFTGLVGPNGSGKSTLMRCLAGILAPEQGVIRIAGYELAAEPLQAKACLGHAPDPSTLPPLLQGRHCLEVFARARGLRAVPAESLALANELGFLPWLDREVGCYSLGTRQKLSVLLALLGTPPLLLLDESLNGLDPVSALALKQHLAGLARSGRCAVLLATHGLEIAQHHLDAVVLLDNGSIRQHWDRVALDALRAAPGGLEQAVVERLRAGS